MKMALAAVLRLDIVLFDLLRPGAGVILSAPVEGIGVEGLHHRPCGRGFGEGVAETHEHGGENRRGDEDDSE